MNPIRWIAPVAVLGIVIALYITLSSTSPSIHEKPENWGVLAPGTETNQSPLPAVDWGVWQRDNPLTSDRMAWFRAQRFGMFVHWGIYAVPAGSYRGVNVPGFSEWILKGGKIPLSEYESYAKQFNPTEFRADELVRLAKRTGMGYLVVTAKHHDGFAMYDSAVSDFTVVKSTPYHHDPLADLATACRAQGLPFGVFYSIMDWRHPQANKAGAEGYMTYMRAQLQELITRYDPAIVWFDGQWVDWWSDERGMALEEFVHRLKPNIVCNGRLAKTNKTIGDFVVTEHQPPGPLLGDRLWEMCQTTNASWGYKASDHQWKSLKELVTTLVDTTSSGGRLLLNVGPDARGKIPPECEKVFLQVGDWLEKNGDSIFKSIPTKIRHPRWGRFMQGTGAQSHLIYATVYEWPTWPKSGELHLDVNVRIRSAIIIATHEVLPLSLNTGGGQVMTLPEKLKGAIPLVIALDMVSDSVSPESTPAKSLP